MKKIKGIKLTDKEVEELRKMTSVTGKEFEKCIRNEEIEKEKRQILKNKIKNKEQNKFIYYLWNEKIEEYEEYEKGKNCFNKSEICQKLGIKRNYINKALEKLDIQFFDKENGKLRLTEKGKKYAIEIVYSYIGINILLLKNAEAYIKRNLNKLPKEWLKEE